MRTVFISGGNRGIGFAAARELARCEPDTRIIIGSRSARAGEAAINKLREAGINNVEYAVFNLLDSHTWGPLIKQIGGPLTVLINNAGIAFKRDSEESPLSQAERTLATNYYATLKFTDHILPFVDRQDGRVIFVSSCLGLLNCISSRRAPDMSAALRDVLRRENITRQDVDAVAERFILAVSKGTAELEGFPSNNYSMSKVLVTAAGRALQNSPLVRCQTDVAICSVHPGYVRTDMTGNKGNVSPEEGCKSIVYCAQASTDPAKLRGSFVWEDCSLVNWGTKCIGS